MKDKTSWGRALTDTELEQVSGGVLFIPMAAVAAGSFGKGFMAGVTFGACLAAAHQWYNYLTSR